MFYFIYKISFNQTVPSSVRALNNFMVIYFIVPTFRGEGDKIFILSVDENKNSLWLSFITKQIVNF